MTKYRVANKSLREIEEEEGKLSTEEHVANYIKSVAAIEECIEPFKEQKKALKQNYVENGWLDKADIKLAMKAYRMFKDEVDLEQLREFYETVGRSVR